MNINIDLPQANNVTRDPVERLNELYRYLFELTSQLSFAFNDITKEINDIKQKLAEIKEGNNGGV